MTSSIIKPFKNHPTFKKLTFELEICLQVKELDSVINSTEFDIPMFIQVHFSTKNPCIWDVQNLSQVYIHAITWSESELMLFFLGVWHVHQRSSLLQAIVFYRHIHVITTDDVAHGCHHRHWPPWSTLSYLWGHTCMLRVTHGSINQQVWHFSPPKEHLLSSVPCIVDAWKTVWAIYGQSTAPSVLQCVTCNMYVQPRPLT